MAENFFARMQRRQEGGKPLPAPTVPWCRWCGSAWVATPGDELRVGGWLAVTIGGAEARMCGGDCLKRYNTTAPRYSEPSAARVEARPAAVVTEARTTSDVGKEALSADSHRKCTDCNRIVEGVHLHCFRCSQPIDGLHVSATMTREQCLEKYMTLGVLVVVNGRNYCGNDCASRALHAGQRLQAEAKAGVRHVQDHEPAPVKDVSYQAGRARALAAVDRADQEVTPAAPPQLGNAAPSPKPAAARKAPAH